MTVVSGLAENKGTLALVIKGNCYEIGQTLKLYVLVGIFDLDRSQIDFEMCLSNRTNRSVPVDIHLRYNKGLCTVAALPT